MNQMQRTLVMLGGLVVVAGLVGVFAWKGIYEKDETTAKQKAEEERLFSTSVDGRGKDAGQPRVEFLKIVVSTGSDTTTVTREPPGPWRITAPVNAKVDPLVIDALTSQLQTSRFKTTLEGEATDEELKTYGLDRPGFVVEAEAEIEGQRRQVKLEGGIENPFDGTIYMRRDGSRTVHMAEGGVRWALAKTTYDLRDKEIFAVDDAKLQRVTLKSSANDWELERGDDKLWRLVRPERTLADGVAVTAMLGSIRGERAVSFPDGDPASLGLTEPLATTVFTTADGPVKVTIFSRRDGEALRFYGVREDAEGRLIAEVNASARTSFDRNPAELRDKSLIPFSKALVTKVVLHTPDQPDVVVERESVDASVEAWRVTSPRAGPARAYKVATMLWTLAAIKSGSVVIAKTDAKVLETYGLDAKQARTVSLVGPDGPLAVLTLGKELVGKSGSSYAIGTRKAIVEIDSSKLNELPWKPEELLDLPTSDAGAP